MKFLVWDDRPPIHGGIFSASHANTISYSNQGTEENQQDAKIRAFSQTVGQFEGVSRNAWLWPPLVP